MGIKKESFNGKKTYFLDCQRMFCFIVFKIDPAFISQIDAISLYTSKSNGHLQSEFVYKNVDTS
jgi:hypothetical protein